MPWHDADYSLTSINRTTGGSRVSMTERVV
jgi:hypothetical protein